MPFRAHRVKAAGRPVQPGWDVAYAVLFLAGDEAAYITGHTIPSTAAPPRCSRLSWRRRLRAPETTVLRGPSGAYSSW
jgi:hypothetical protein